MEFKKCLSWRTAHTTFYNIILSDQSTITPYLIKYAKSQRKRLIICNQIGIMFKIISMRTDAHGNKVLICILDNANNIYNQTSIPDNCIIIN